jgi:hypothetical protein
MSRDGDELLTCAVDNVEDGGVTVGRRKLFDEVEGDRMPRSGWYRKLLNKTERFVSWVLVPFAGDTAVNKVLNISTYVRPGVLSAEQVEGSVLARVSCGQVIVLEL